MSEVDSCGLSVIEKARSTVTVRFSAIAKVMDVAIILYELFFVMRICVSDYAVSD